MTQLFSRTDDSALSRWWWTVDRPLLAVLIAMAVMGVVMVAAASPPVAERIGLDQYHFIKKHLILLGPAMVTMIGISLLSPRWVWRIGSIAFIGALLAMVAVLFIGMEIKGARRWLDLPLINLQPSEFMKPALAIMAAWLLAREKEDPSFPGQKVAIGLFVVVLSLLVLQPDFGMSVVTSAIFGVQLFLAGLPWAIVLGLLGLAAVGVLGAYFGLEHVRSRVDRFLDPSSGDSYQVDKALQAFKEGGVMGAGPGQGEVKLHLPDAHADFIFAVAGEEGGLIVTIILVGLFAFLLLRGFNRMMDSKDMFSILAVGGLLTMFGMQALVHMGANTQMLPAKGMTLPFISYGGTSLLAVGFSAGVILALTRRQARSGIAKSSMMRKGK